VKIEKFRIEPTIELKKYGLEIGSWVQLGKWENHLKKKLEINCN